MKLIPHRGRVGESEILKSRDGCKREFEPRIRFSCFLLAGCFFVHEARFCKKSTHAKGLFCTNLDLVAQGPFSASFCQKRPYIKGLKKSPYAKRALLSKRDGAKPRSEARTHESTASIFQVRHRTNSTTDVTQPHVTVVKMSFRSVSNLFRNPDPRTP